MPPAPIRIALTCDTDADLFDPSLGSAASLSSPPQWRGVAEGIPAMIGMATEIAAAFGLKPRFTWFVRVDDHIGHFHGDPCFLLRRWAPLWAARAAAGDEIAWHPHIYQFVGERWEREHDDARFIAALDKSHGDFARIAGPPQSSRIGEAAFSNAIAACLDRLGIACDSSAMPGRARRDAERVIDWSISPRSPYRPAIEDYRRPGPDARGLLEVPMSMVMVKADYDSQAYLRYVDLSFHPEALQAGLAAFLGEASLLVSMTHPSGILREIHSGRHGLIAFDPDAYRSNLDFILRRCRALERPIEFVTVAECRTLFGHDA